MTEELITTYKNGQEKVWTRRQWEILGSDKHGWVVVPQTPKEVAQVVEQQPKATHHKKVKR